MTSDNEQDPFIRGFHGIPDDEKLKAMSFAELASEISSCEAGSPKFIVIEREMKRHLARDQANINRFNILLGACVGGIFGLIGVALGFYLKNDVATPDTMQHTSNIAEKRPVAQELKSPISTQPAGASVDVQEYATTNQTKP